eukprot:402781_1
MPGAGHRRMDDITDSDSGTDLTTSTAAMQGLDTVTAATSPVLTQRFCAHPSHNESSRQDNSLYDGRLTSGYVGHRGEWVAREEASLHMVEGTKKRFRRGLFVSPSASTSSVSMDEPPAPVSSVLTGLKRLRVASSSGLCSPPLQVGWDEEKSGRPDPPPPQGWHDINPQHAAKFLEQQNIYPQDVDKEEKKLQDMDSVHNGRNYYGDDVQYRYSRGIRVQAGIHDVNYGQVNSLLHQLHLERISNRSEP